MERGLETLLDLDGSILVQTDAGHWIGVRVKRVARTPRRPHGISYSLTFHAPDNTRILGYDNAHGTATRRVPFDHRHKHPSDKGTPYTFRTAEQPLKDFFSDVDDWLKRHG